MSRAVDVKAELTQSLRYLHLPTVRQCYEEVAQQAERESLSYERYLHELVQPECEERQGNRIAKMLRDRNRRPRSRLRPSTRSGFR